MINLPTTITYEIENSLYLNITNRCTNHCTFCVRNNSDGVVSGLNLWLKREPTVDEILENILNLEISKYKEFVFCGYGEPLMRTYDLIEICKKLKASYNMPIRINTNGQANLINGCDITPLLEGLVDTISISLNAKDKQEYQALCLSDFGETAFEGILDFTAKCQKYIPKVVLSVVDLISGEDIQACKQIVEGIGVDFRVRHLAV
ncbi:Radical SAM, TatD-associated, bacteria [Candidatus Desulfosporosinus infrequens]|uniref:Radical SAM, TatD-associated, bacteria n=1 Tax=Candidatus Desulfosporosinus infrequens TaxID=2043169 RepID=A0A2U3JWU7_9FIRM|nr:Radical SAM, TatD-associated, bacteria [Candidatus Desulfosporosinus infrequens]